MTADYPERDDASRLEQEYDVRGEGEGPARSEPIPRKRMIALIAGPVVAVIALLFPAPEGMPPEAWRLVALAAWMVIWWLGEAVPIPATALLPIPMMPLLGIAEMKAVAANFEVSTWMLICIVLVAIVYLTEITSNTATTATFLPILGAVAVGLGIAPQMLAIPVALAASMAFMMPVATPPNAIVFSYEDLHLGDMVKAGFWLNIVAIATSFCAMYFLAGPVFGVFA